MSPIDRLADAVRRLSPEELAAFRRWFADYDAEMWDRQLERDSDAGRLDDLADEAMRDLREGRCKDL